MFEPVSGGIREVIVVTSNVSPPLIDKPCNSNVMSLASVGNSSAFGRDNRGESVLPLLSGSSSARSNMDGFDRLVICAYAP